MYMRLVWPYGLAEPPLSPLPETELTFVAPNVLSHMLLLIMHYRLAKLAVMMVLIDWFPRGNAHILTNDIISTSV